MSDAARKAIQAALKVQQQRRVFRVKAVHSLSEPSRRSGERARRGGPLVGAWKVEVARGSEQAILRELEYRVARALEQAGGYEGIDPRLSLAVARTAMAAHQARRVRLSSQDLLPSAPIDLKEHHEKYRSMVATGPEPTTAVSVAILDSAVQPEHLYSTVLGRVRLGDVADDVAAIGPLAHGAATASVIGDLAPTAEIEVYPVAGEEPVDEWPLIRALQRADAQVIAMCLQLSFTRSTNPKTAEDAVGDLLRGLDKNTVVVVSSGNREDNSDSAQVRFPATYQTVLAVGAIDSKWERPFFSCHLLDQDRPCLFLVAPGGHLESDPPEFSVLAGDEPVVGTSVAAAYAAGVIARCLGSGGFGERPIEAQELLAKLKAAALKPHDKYVAIEHGDGLVQQLK
jgi:hypothetical protein